MKVRFYTDIPPSFVAGIGYNLCASTATNYTKPEGWKRVAFDVDLPPELCSGDVDVKAPATFTGIVED